MSPRRAGTPSDPARNVWCLTSNQEGVVGGFFNFDRMITPTIIKIVFWLGLIVSVAIGLLLLIAGHSVGIRIAGLLYLILGPLFTRIYAEILIVIFKMHESLVSINRNTAHLGQAPSAPSSDLGPTPTA